MKEWPKWKDYEKREVMKTLGENIAKDILSALITRNVRPLPDAFEGAVETDNLVPASYIPDVAPDIVTEAKSTAVLGMFKCLWTDKYFDVLSRAPDLLKRLLASGAESGTFASA